MTSAPKPAPLPAPDPLVQIALLDLMMQMQLALGERQGALDDMVKLIALPPPMRRRKSRPAH